MLIGEVTYSLVRSQVEVEAVEPLELKGKAERVPAYRLIEVRDATVPARAHLRCSARRAGTTELEQLHDGLRETVGRGGCPS